MREIKFRAWDKDTYTMILPDEIARIHLNPTPFALTTLRGKTGGASLQFILMQYTGLKDKTGKEIYEGDIVKNQIGSIGKMVFSHIGNMNGWTGFFVNYKGTGNHWPVRGNDIEIIGNIHERPELLEAKE